MYEALKALGSLGINTCYLQSVQQRKVLTFPTKSTYVSSTILHTKIALTLQQINKLLPIYTLLALSNIAIFIPAKEIQTWFAESSLHDLVKAANLYREL